MKIGEIFFLFFIIIILSCSSMPVETENSYSIRLNLEYIGNVQAEFSGESIKVIIETNDSIYFSSLTWRTGNGLYTVDDSTLLKKKRKFNAYLSWNTYPRNKDTTDNAYYDTVFVGIGGNIQRSNVVIVKVSNLPVVIDSLRVDTNTFKTSDSIWSYSVHDTTSKLHIRVFARDLDNKTPDMMISGSNIVPEKYQGDPFHVSYTCPTGHFKDTLIFILFDHAQGQAIRKLYLNRNYTKELPVIDSISINSSIFMMEGGKTNAIFDEIDTLKFHIFYHSIYSTVKTIVWRLKKNDAIIDTKDNTNMTMICTTSTCKTDTSGNLVPVDTLRVAIYDSNGDSAVGYVYIKNGFRNTAPVIKKILVDNTVINDTNTNVTNMDGIGYGKKVFAVDVYDPESNTVTCSWNVSSGTLNADTGISVTYTAPGALTKDTITVTVSDSELTESAVIIVNINDIIPVFDSLTINKKVYITPVDTARYSAFHEELVVITTWIRDLDKKDTSKYVWNAKDSTMIKSKVDNRLIIQTNNKTEVDTVTLTITDGIYSSKFKVLIDVNAPEPVIDSIMFGDTIYKNLQKDIVDSAFYPDTIAITIFAHDLQEDTITYGCESLIKNIYKISTAAYRYSTLDSTYIDTLAIFVMDTKNNTNIRNIILNVKGGNN